MATHDAQILIRLPRDLADAIATIARQNCRSTSAEARIAIEEHVALEAQAQEAASER